MNHKPNFKTNVKVQGNTVRRLFDRTKMASYLRLMGVAVSAKQESDLTLLYEAGINHGLSAAVMQNIMEKSEKPMFAVNGIWKFFKKHFDADIVIPLITGQWKYGGIVTNTITDVGKKICADQVGGTTTAPVTAVAIGIGTPSTTALGSEIASGGGSRGAATVSNQTTSSTGDTERWIKTYNFTSTFAVTEEGLFDNNTSGGKMLASQSFSAVNVNNGDSLQITHNVVFS